MNSIDNAPWAQRRQIIIASVVGFVVLGILVSLGFFFFYKPPSCTDGKQNQDEKGIDCGGVCARICEDDSQAIVIEWVRLFKIRDGVYSVAARVQNPATRTIAKDAPYTFTLKDASGNVVATRSGTTFIPARDVFVVFEGTIQTSAEPTTVSFSFDGAPAWQRSDYVQPTLAIINKQLADIENRPRMVATIQNQNLTDVRDVTLDALIYDDQGNAVQVSETYVKSIKAGETIEATFTWPHPISLRSRICESPVDTALVIDRSGSMEFLGKNPPQPLTDVKEAANSYLAELSKFDQASVVSFANEASHPIDAFLSPNIKTVQDAVDRIAITQPPLTQNTNIGDGIKKAFEELTSERHREKSGKIMVVLTDGVATRPLKAGAKNYPETYAQAIANQAKEAGVRIFTIGLGKDLNQNFLKNIASTSTDFYLAPTASDLEGIYREIGTKMCKRQPTTLEIVPSIPL